MNVFCVSFQQIMNALTEKRKMIERKKIERKLIDDN